MPICTCPSQCSFSGRLETTGVTQGCRSRRAAPYVEQRFYAARTHVHRAPGPRAEKKGFGSSGGADGETKKKVTVKKKSTKDSNAQKAVNEAVRLAEGGSVRRIEPREAAKGKVDRVQVKDWGAGKVPEDLGSLQVEKFSPGPRVNPNATFYELLARRLEWLEAQGMLQIAEAAGEKALPPFERWSFSEKRYIQYLCDQQAIHYQLESAIEQALSYAAGGNNHLSSMGGDGEAQGARSQETATSTSSNGASAVPEVNTATETAGAVAPQGSPPTSGKAAAPAAEACPGAGALGGPSTRMRTALDALAYFCETRGLDRSLEILSDLQEIAKSSQLNPNEPLLLSPTQNTQAYTHYLDTLGHAAQDCEITDEEREEAVLRLVANAYTVQVTHLTTGFRIGAAATEKLDLFNVGAVNFYQNYPSPLTLRGADPLRAFMSNVNAAGALLSEAQREGVMNELPKGMISCAKTLYILAHE